MRINQMGFICGIIFGTTVIGCSKTGSSASADHQQAARKIKFYRNPMQASITSPVPAKDSMGMDYVPVYEDEASGASSSNQNSLPDGQAIVRLDEVKEQRIGVKLSTVEMRDLIHIIRAPARVAYDPTETSNQKNKSGTQASIDIYEYEAALVKPGQVVEYTSAAFPGKTFRGKIRGVDSAVNAEFRTLRVRADVSNSEGELTGEMYLNASVQVDLGSQLALPKTAVIDTGVRQLAYVQKEPGVYEPREVKLGREGEGYYIVLNGLKSGDRVVTSANFLIDSESKINAAAQGR